MAPLVTPGFPVADEEVLYRATRPSHISKRDGRVVISSQAFYDPTEEISVDRACLQGFNPHITLNRLRDAGAVLSVSAVQVRSLAPITHEYKDSKNRPLLDEQGQTKIAANGVNVFPDPLPPEAPDNQAHALIKGVPPFPHNKMFKRLIERLALIPPIVEIDMSAT